MFFLVLYWRHYRDPTIEHPKKKSVQVHNRCVLTQENEIINTHTPHKEKENLFPFWSERDLYDKPLNQKKKGDFYRKVQSCISICKNYKRITGTNYNVSHRPSINKLVMSFCIILTFLQVTKPLFLTQYRSIFFVLYTSTP